jgi:hypothetical protein
MSRPPWLDILRSGPFWGLLSATMSHGFIATTAGTYLPLYLNDVLKFDVTSVFFSPRFSIPTLKKKITKTQIHTHIIDSKVVEMVLLCYEIN